MERDFDAEAIGPMKLPAERDLSVGGPQQAAHAFAAGLVEDCHLFLNPIAVGGGKPALPPKQTIAPDLVDQHIFDNGVVHLHYRVAPSRDSCAPTAP